MAKSSTVRQLLPLAAMPLVVGIAIGAAPGDDGHGAARQAELAATGREIFLDTRLSNPPGQGCVSCHVPEAAFADPRPVSPGAVAGRSGNRNAPSLMYAALIPNLDQEDLLEPDGQQIWVWQGGMFQDGSARTLHEQVRKPFFNHAEMNVGGIAELAAKIRKAEYAGPFKAAMNDADWADDGKVAQRVYRALVEFLKEPMFRPFDARIDHHLAGDESALTEQERRGLEVFKTKGKCAGCHLLTATAWPKPLLSDYGYDNLGAPARGTPDAGLGGHTGVAEEVGQFRAPSLRNVALTAPYLHNGSIATLRELMEFYNRRDVEPGRWGATDFPATVNHTDLGNLGLDDSEVDDLVALMDAFTDRSLMEMRKRGEPFPQAPTGTPGSWKMRAYFPRLEPRRGASSSESPILFRPIDSTLKMIPHSPNRAHLFALLLAAAPCLPAWAQTGPMVGTVKTTEAWFLYRPGAEEKALRLSVLDADGQVVATSSSTSAAGDDYVAKFRTAGLSASTNYSYKVEDVSGAAPVLLAGPADGLRFKTPLPAGAKGVVTAAFVSCANSTSEPVWQRIGELGVDQLFFCGDTPYIDTSDLTTIRAKHRGFLETPFMSSLIRRTSSVGTWDDHDFGLNASNGLSFAAGKPNTRKGFVEYRAHAQFGTGTEGVYHKIDIGLIEVFLLDPRWFSQTAASPVDPSQKTGFGAAQWQWIKDGLKASKAPFKVLALGEVWEDKKNSETDDLFTYWYERDALFDFIRDEGIPGVVLIGGDIHVSRHLIHPQRVGYDLHDFVTSPAHTSVIPSLDVAHPSLEWSSQQGRQFLTLTADTRSNPARLTARYVLHDGTVQREVVIPYGQLTPKKGGNLGRGLRAWWAFDGNFSNQSVLGPRIDATAVNGTALVADGGLRGGAAGFSRASQQYLRIPRSALDDNTAGYTASLWCKPATLPAHGTAERSFLMESTLNGTISGEAAYSISVGFKADDADASKVNLELFTHTLQRAVSTSASPTATPQGPFPCGLDRSLFTNRWAHVGVTFDSGRLKMYVDGALVADHALPTPGPLAEVGGLIIGGHRAGTGRNFDGLIDEVALWSRALAASEITDLHHSGTPQALPIQVTAIDTDGDTLQGSRESLHGLDPGNADDALADTDADQVPAWLEYQVGTDPQHDDPGLFDYLREQFQPDADPAQFVFRHPSQRTLPLRLAVRASDDLDEWSSLLFGTGAEAPAESSDFTLTVPPAPDPKRFFQTGGTTP